ncbi:MAG: FHA domain-containing protein [Polyangiaceae bacterium]
MPVTLVIHSDEDTGDRGTLPRLTFDGGRVVIGRSQGCDVRLPDVSVSQRHASLRSKGGEYVIVDEESTNGTFVGGVRLAARTPRSLRTGDLVRVGRVWLEIRIDQTPATRDLAAATKDLALELVSHAMRRMGAEVHPIVSVAEGRDAGAAFVLADEGRVYLVGRGEHCDLRLADGDVVREHVQIVRRGNVVLARDVGGRAGVVLGDASLAGDRDTAWKPAWMLKVGRSVLALTEPVVEALSDLEQSEDEAIPADEAADPPATVRAMEAEARAEAEKLDREERDARAQRELRAVVPAPPERRESGWSTADFAVMGAALSLLVLSVVGLFWLLRG